MTLQNGLAMGEKALLWTDTAFTNPFTHETIGYAEKAFHTRLFPAIVSASTVGALPDVIRDFVYDRNPERLGDLLQACEDAARHYCTTQPELATVRLMVAGWCYETESARLFVVASDSPWGPPFEAVEMDSYISSANESAAYRDAVANGFTVERMLAIAEAQRLEPIAPDKGGFTPFYGIGGHLVEYEVNRGGVACRVVKEWGEPPKMARAA
jgi:hypothetical protein